MLGVEIIAETAFSHEGDEAYIYKITKLLCKTDVDIIKFQILLSPEYADDHPFAQRARSFLISSKSWVNVIDIARNSGKKVLILPVDLHALEWSIKSDFADIIEIHSVNLFRRDFYDSLKKLHGKTQICLSVSGYSIGEIDFIVNEYLKILKSKIFLMFGYQSFPTSKDNVGLFRVSQLKSRFGLQVGYADHTDWHDSDKDIISCAIGQGASFIEKHVALEEDSKRVDGASAITVDSLKELVFFVRKIDKIMGSRKTYILSDDEVNYGDRRLRLVAKKSISDGEILTLLNTEYKWTLSKSSLNPRLAYEAIESVACKNYLPGDVIS